MNWILYNWRHPQNYILPTRANLQIFAPPSWSNFPRNFKNLVANHNGICHTVCIYVWNLKVWNSWSLFVCNIDTSNFEFYSQNFTTTHSDSSLKYIIHYFPSNILVTVLLRKTHACFVNSGRFVFLPKNSAMTATFRRKDW